MRTSRQDGPNPHDVSISSDEIVRLANGHRILIACTAGTVILATALLLALSPPTYRAKATLLLDSDRQAGGILGDLAMLSRQPLAVSEIEVLKSRSVAESVVAAEEELELQTVADPLTRRHLGLTTLVEDESLAFLGSLTPASLLPGERDREGTRLLASAVPHDRDAASAVRVEFLSSGRVRLSMPGLSAKLRPGSAKDLECDYQPGAAVHYGGLVVRLEAIGDLRGKSFLVRHLSADEAVERVLAATRIVETAPNSGVMEVCFDDSDPRRAAEVANALCRNYLDRSVKRGEKRASQTVEFTEAQLKAQMTALDAAEREVVRLEQRSPQAVDIGKAAEALIHEQSELELQRIRIELSRTALREALERMDAGQFEALSRLAAEIADPVSEAYVQQIALLSTEAELQDRNDTGVYKSLLQSKMAETQLHADRVAVDSASLEQTIADIERGDTTAFARLGGSDGAERSGDPLTAACLVQLADQIARLRESEHQLTPEHPEVIALGRAVAEVQDRLLGLARGRLAGLQEEQAQYAILLQGYGERLAEVPHQERPRIDSALGRIRERAQSHLHHRLDGLDASAVSLAKEMENLQKRLGELPEEQRVLADPKRRLEAHAEIVKFLLNRQQEAELARASTIAGAELIDPAVPPRRRHGPSVVLVLGGAAVLGLLFGFGAAFVRESLEMRIRTAAELETVTVLPLLATIPDFRKVSRGVGLPGKWFLALRDDPEGPIAEAYRSLRANLKFVLDAEAEVKALGVTSTLEGEGKSSTAFGAAMSLATSGKRVLLVDADMRQPVVHQYLSVPREPGLTDVLGGRIQWKECIRETGLVNLHVLPAGAASGRVGDLLAGASCRQLVRSLRDAYDLVLFDLPPAMAVADSENLAPCLDAMVLVCRSRWTPQNAVARTVDRLKHAGARWLGCVLNAAEVGKGEDAYGYGYGYGEQDGRARKGSKRSRSRLGQAVS